MLSYNQGEAMRHFVSFLRSPLGYVCNLLATVFVHAEKLHEPAFRWVGDKLAPACETFCLRDGVQDDMLF